LGATESDIATLYFVLVTNGTVSQEQFKHLLRWFGTPKPINSEFDFQDGITINQIAQLLEKPWFHGFISGNQAFSLLENQPAGTWLIRFSSSPPDFAITMKPSNEVPCHWKIEKINNGFSIFDRNYSDLFHVVGVHSKEGLKLANGTVLCPLLHPLPKQSA